MTVNIKPFIRTHLSLVIFLLLFASLGTYYLINSFAASSPNVYIAQASAGTADGSSCADAEPVSFFNTASNWGSSSGQIGPGTTVHLCGTITTSLTAQGSGASGSPVTIYFESNSRISQPVCSGACLNISGQSYITVDGGSGGIIENTANGSGLASQAASNGVNAASCNGCTIKNLTVQNIYQHTSASDVSSNAQSTGGIDISGSNITVINNTIDNVATGIYYDPGSTDTNNQIEGNNIYGTNWAIAVVRQSNGGTIGPIYINGNHLHDWASWDTTSDTFHHNGIHCYTGGSSPTPPHYTGFYVYDNRVDGTTGADATADVWFEPASLGNPCGDSTSDFYVFNNVLDPSDTAPGNGNIAPQSGDVRVWNNTIEGQGTNSGNGLYLDYGGTADLRNNLIEGGTLVQDLGPSSVTLSPAPDYNFFANGGSNAFVCNGYYSFPAGFANWQSCSGGDSHGTAYSGTFSLNSDGSLQSGSPAIGAAANLTSDCNTFPNSPVNVQAACEYGYRGPPPGGTAGSTTPGVPRPATGAWDAGAYQHNGTYYIDYATGSDSNSGASESSPWKEAPGMQGFCSGNTGGCASYVSHPGDHFIFKGGVTWPSSVFPLVVTNAGASGDSTYYGVDKAWYTGSSWARPLFIGQGQVAASGDCTTTKSFADGIGYSIDVNQYDTPPFIIADVDNVTIDGFDMSNFYWTCGTANGGSGGSWLPTYVHAQGSNVVIENSYFHGWTHSPGESTDPNTCVAGPRSNQTSVLSCDDLKIIYGSGSGSIAQYDVFDGSINGQAGDSGEAAFMIARHDTVENMPNAFLPSSAAYCEVSNSKIGPITQSYTGNHTNYVEDLNSCSQGIYVFDNYMFGATGGVVVFVGNPGCVASGGGCHVYNNVFYNNSPNPIQLDGRGSGSSSCPCSADVYNNTFENPDSSGYAVRWGAGGGLGSWGSLATANNHYIGYAGTQPAGGSDTLADSNDCVQTNAQATSEGYIQGSLWAPSSNSGCTVKAGKDLSGQNLFTADINGTARPPNAWDIGAYQYTSPITTDLNSDSHVNIFDLSIFLDHLGQSGSNLPGDFNSDGKVDAADLTTLQGQWGR